jgi:hypothetical protein
VSTYVFLVTYREQGRRVAVAEVFDVFEDALQETALYDEGNDVQIIQVLLDPLAPEGRQDLRDVLTHQVCLGCEAALPSSEFSGGIPGVCKACEAAEAQS